MATTKDAACYDVVYRESPPYATAIKLYWPTTKKKLAWLPEGVADAFCSLALHQDPTRPYGSFHEVQLGFNEHYQALLHIEGQKAVVAWDNAPSNRIMVSLLLPGPMEMDQWLKDVRASLNMWPLQKTAHEVTNQMTTEVFMRRERRRLQARHVWEKIEPDWTMIRDRVWTKQATGLPYDALRRRLFLHDYTEESRWLENSYKGPHWRWIQQQWKNCQAWFAGQAVARSPSRWVSTLYLHGLDQLDALSWQWINQHVNLVEQVWHTQQGTFLRKRPPDVRDDPMSGQ